MKKVMCIFGTRPEAIKMAPVVKELQKHSDKIESFVCVTAQHRQMLDEALKMFDIKPDFDLDIMKDNQSLFEITANALLSTKNILQDKKIDLILVQGDTTTAFSVALAAFYLKIPIAHVEAGLRTDDKYNPFPEEINRRLTSSLTDVHLAPTEKAKNNLLREGFDEKSIFVTGNTVIDALFWILRNTKGIEEELFSRFSFLGSDSNRLILVTAHRRESFGGPLENICCALKKIAEKNKKVHIVYSVHPNPNVQSTVKKILGSVERIHLISPLRYDFFVHLMSKAYFILTDSGGVQEEAPSLGKPILVMRDNTERSEAVEAGAARLVGTKIDKIVEHAERLLCDKTEYQRMSKAVNPFGNGKAAERIVNIVLERLK